MTESSSVLEYKCPCCEAGLTFDNESQNLTCEYCGTTFEFETVRAYNQLPENEDGTQFQWEEPAAKEWTQQEQSQLLTFSCPSCGGELVTDSNTAATFCPFCGNPAVIAKRLTGGLKPDAVIPFKTGKEDAKKAFLQLCKGKPLLPKDFTDAQRVEKITGIYVPFWLYHCEGDQQGRYNATRIRHWSDSHYRYTRTDYFLLTRSARAEFNGIPMDGSSKMEDAIMESIEPYDYSQLVDFDSAYLTGFLADKYDVESKEGEGRIQQRVQKTIDSMVSSSMFGYSSVIPTSRQLRIQHSQAKYALLPVWILHSKYKDKTYTFAMNGQTGKMTGSFPICPKRSWAWFGGICAAVSALALAIQMFVL